MLEILCKQILIILIKIFVIKIINYLFIEVKLSYAQFLGYSSYSSYNLFDKKKIEINILLIKIEDKNHYNKIKDDNRSFEPNYSIKNLLFWTRAFR